MRQALGGCQKMKNYFREQEFFVEHIWFDYDGCRHSGHGIMTWSPMTGFHIAALIKRSKPLPPRKDIKVISLNRTAVIRMKLYDEVLAVAPKVSLDDMAVISGQFSLDVNCLIFVQRRERGRNSTSWFGSALYETKTNLTLPDTVIRETRIGDWQPSLSYSSSGFHFESDTGQRVVGQLTDKKRLDVNWSLPYSVWSKIDNWHFAKSLQDAISMVAGEAIQLRCHESYRYGRIYKEMRVGEPPFNLPILFRPLDQEILDKDIVMQLANFLTHNHKESDICRKIFYQMIDASRQKTWQGRELLLSTILEAALRTLYDHPFAPDKNKRTDTFSLNRLLKTFREQYLSDTTENGRRWKKVTNRASEVHKRLRDRNAHPDWSPEQGGAYSSEKLEQTINDLIFLSRFYGYMILALAGFKGMEPRFPKPFTDWEPFLTFTRTNNEDTQNS